MIVFTFVQERACLVVGQYGLGGVWRLRLSRYHAFEQDLIGLGILGGSCTCGTIRRVKKDTGGHWSLIGSYANRGLSARGPRYNDTQLPDKE